MTDARIVTIAENVSGTSDLVGDIPGGWYQAFITADNFNATAVTLRIRSPNSIQRTLNDISGQSVSTASNSSFTIRLPYLVHRMRLTMPAGPTGVYCYLVSIPRG